MKNLWLPSHSQGHGVIRPLVSLSLSFLPLYIPSLTPSACGTAARGCPLEVQKWCPQCCWLQPDIHFMGLVSGQLSGTIPHTQTSLLGPSHEHSPPCWAHPLSRWTMDRPRGGWALGTLFSSRADQAKVTLVSMFSLWLEVSGCLYNADGQINWDGLCIGIVAVTWKFHHANTSAGHQRERNQNPGAEQSQKLDNPGVTSEVYDSVCSVHNLLTQDDLFLIAD